MSADEITARRVTARLTGILNEGDRVRVIGRGDYGGMIGTVSATPPIVYVNRSNCYFVHVEGVRAALILSYPGECELI